MKLDFVKACISEVEREESGATVMAADEENALRYASGYVPFKLLKRYLQQMEHDPEAEAVADILSQMAVPGEISSYYDYTKEWVEQVNRGGLFIINNETYLFFKQLVLLTRHHLAKELNPSVQGAKKSRDNIISDIKSDDDLLFLWEMLVVYISAERADKLLTDIVTLWLSIRGHSMAAAWLHEYKEAKEVLTRKKKGLRKELKKADTSTTG